MAEMAEQSAAAQARRKRSATNRRIAASRGVMRIDAAREIAKDKLDAKNGAQISRVWQVIKRRFKYRRMLQQDNGLGEGVSSWAKVFTQMKRRFKRAEYGLVPTVMLERRTLLEMLGEEGDVEESEGYGDRSG